MSVKALLLVVDAQKAYSLDDSDLKVNHVDAILKNINKVISWFKDRNLPVIYTRHMHESDGSDSGRMFDFTGKNEKLQFVKGTKDVDYLDGLLKLENGIEIIKTRYSIFIKTEFDKILKELNINKIVIVGFMTNFCCESTARDAHDRDYFVDFIIDATGTINLNNITQEQIKNCTSATLSEGYANVITTEEFLSNK